LVGRITGARRHTEQRADIDKGDGVIRAQYPSSLATSIQVRMNSK
jgi:hypothetical protein